MLLAYAMGIFLVVGLSYSNKYDDFLLFDFEIKLLFSHFMLSVAISGSFAPHMYINLNELIENQRGVPSTSAALPSLQFASSAEPGVRRPSVRGVLFIFDRAYKAGSTST